MATQHRNCRQLNPILLAICLIFLSVNAHSQMGGHSLKFARTSSQYVSLGANITELAKADFTIEAWIRTTGTWPGASSSILACDDADGIWEAGEKLFYIHSGGTPRFEGHSNEYIKSTQSVNDNKWHHIAVVWDYSGSGTSGTGYIYIDGANKTDPASNYTANFTNVGTFYLVRPNSAFYSGLLDEVRIWNTARTEAQIKANMNREIAAQSGLVAYYKMSDGSGATLTDNSGNGYSGTLVNSPSWQASGCLAGPRQALDLDGIDDYVSVNDGGAISFTNQVTIECWVRQYSQRMDDQCIISRYYSPNNGVVFMISIFGGWRGGDAGKIEFGGDNAGWSDNWTVSDIAINDGIWHHIACVYNGATRSIFIDGLISGSELISGNFAATPNQPVLIGSCIRYGPRYLNSGIDELRIWNVARTAAEIRENMCRTLNGNESGLRAYYRFDHSDGTILYDLTANGYNGTLVNMDPATDWVASSAFNTWIGSESGDWGTAANWSADAVPGTDSNAGLYKLSLGNETSLSGSPSLRSLLVSGTASPVFSSGFTTTGSAIFLNSAALCGGYALNSAASLYIESGKTLTIPFDGRLTVNGLFVNNGTLTLQSSAAGTASLIQSTAGVTAVVQRYMDNSDWNIAYDGWHFLSSPVASQPISPSFTADPATDYAFYCWDEPSRLWVNYKNTSGGGGTAPYFDVVNGSMAFVPGRGYLATYNQGGTKTFSGILNKDNIAVTGLTLSGSTQTGSGWHLLGNPFSSALTWDASADWNLTNIAGVAKIWNEALQDYSDLTSVPASVIPATNGFMVQVTSGNGSLTLPQTKRSHSSQGFYKSTVPCLKLIITNTTTGTAKESTVIFHNLATDGYDPMYDGIYLHGNGPEFYSCAKGNRLSTNCLPFESYSLTIPFDFIPGGGSSYVLKVIELTGINGPVILLDHKNNKSQELTLEPVYAFTSVPGDNPARFNICFGSAGGEDSPRLNDFAIATSGNTITVKSPANCGDCFLSLFDLTGRLRCSYHMAPNVSETITPAVPPGCYVLIGQAEHRVVTRKIILY